MGIDKLPIQFKDPDVNRKQHEGEKDEGNWKTGSGEVIPTHIP